MSKFKVGDRVRFIRDGIGERQGVGREDIVVAIDHRGNAVVSSDPDTCSSIGWSSGTVEVITDPVTDATTLTRRDHFAMAALTGLLANSEAVTAGMEPTVSYLANNKDGSWLAETSFMLADAMEAARNKGAGSERDA